MRHGALLSVAKHVQYLNHLIAIVKIDAERKMIDPNLSHVSDEIEASVKYHLDSIDKALERR